MLKAAGLFLFAPVLTGTLLGYMIKVLERGTQDQTSFMATMMFDLMPVGISIAAVGLAIATFAFMASSLSLIDSWLLACSQTLSWDLIDHDKFKAVNFKVTEFDPVTHEQVTRRARIALLLVGIIGASCVYYISKYIWGNIFQLQFVIFGGGLAMLPSLLYAIFCGNPSGSRVVSGAALASIVLGYAAALTLFAYSLINSEPDAVSPLPLVSLIVATIVFIAPIAPMVAAPRCCPVGA